MNLKTQQRASTPTTARGLLIFTVILCLVGLGVSIELSRIHYLTHTDPTYRSICAVSEAVNCETVAQSPFSVFLGLPISAWGVIGYLVMATFALSGFSDKRLRPEWPAGVLFGFFAVALAATAALAYISLTRIDSLCLFCAGLYGVNLLLFAGAVVHFAKTKVNPVTALFGELKAFFTKPKVVVIVVTAVAVPLALTYLLTPRYWHHPGWEDLPELPTGQSAEHNFWIGAETPLVTIHEFSDYECPHCRGAQKRARLLAARYPNEVRLVHHHLPLDSACNDTVSKAFHPRACELAKASECAGEQGAKAFWQMNDAIFSSQDTARAASIDVATLAVKLGLDRTAFNQCLQSDATLPQIKKDIKEGQRRQVKGTPTFFIGDQPHPGGVPASALEEAVEQARARAKTGQ